MKKRKERKVEIKRIKARTDHRPIVNSDGYETGCGAGKQHKYFATGSSKLFAATGARTTDGDDPQSGWTLHLSTTTAKSS